MMCYVLNYREQVHKSKTLYFYREVLYYYSLFQIKFILLLYISFHT
jgi:hypothetical protein